MSKRSRRNAAASDKFPVPWIVAVAVVLIGGALGASVGQHFVFQFGKQYGHLALFAFLVLVPAVAVIRLLGNQGELSGHGPKQSPLFAVLNWVISNGLIAAAIIYSPFGYIALVHQAVGHDMTIAAKVCCVKDLKQKRKTSCSRSAQVIVESRQHWVCLADHYAPNTDISGMDVLLDIRQSSLGFSMGRVAPAPPAVAP